MTEREREEKGSSPASSILRSSSGAERRFPSPLCHVRSAAVFRVRGATPVSTWWPLWRRDLAAERANARERRYFR